MAAMLFDTLELSKALQPSFTPEQAEALVHALGKASSDQLATKADFAELKTAIFELKTATAGDIAELKMATAGEIAELKTAISELKTATAGDIAELKTATAGEIAELKAATKADIMDLKTDVTAQISALRAGTIKWIVSAIAFNFVATAGLIITLTKVFGK